MIVQVAQICLQFCSNFFIPVFIIGINKFSREGKSLVQDNMLLNTSFHSLWIRKFLSNLVFTEMDEERLKNRWWLGLHGVSFVVKNSAPKTAVNYSFNTVDVLIN
jgi:hypothetical protein